MADVPPFEAPVITDDDIRRVCGLLDLPEHAFCGRDGCDPRDEVLKCMATADVAACPGSGKTTLLVAKLAILAEKWPHRTRGICVLSHTNAAREQIETRLGNTVAGRHLLSYPHYIGTIHGFVDAFLAIPWLRSRGYQVKMIDTPICQEWRLRKLPWDLRRRIESNRRGSAVLSITSAEFDVDIPWGKGRLQPGGGAYETCRDVCCQSARNGYFCYDEMFIWADDLIERIPGAVTAIRDRFPLLFLDEVQDNSDRQSRILQCVFMAGDRPVMRQRFGDPNQAIFDSLEATGATSDTFPDTKLKMGLPNSHRFGKSIADLADPLGLVPYRLVGDGPGRPLDSGVTTGQHTVFLFGEGDAQKVLPAYGDLLLKTFSDRELGDEKLVAVGHRHKPPDKQNDGKYPYVVGDYWPEYDSQLVRQDPRPRSLAQYILAGMSSARVSGDTHHCVEKIAEGILRLAGMSNRHTRKHRYLMQLLHDDTCARRRYEALLEAFAANREVPTKETWTACWCRVAREIAGVAAECALSSDETSEFLKWPDASGDPQGLPTPAEPPGNIFHHERDGRGVGIRVGSIHSVKGETHAATLVVETVYHEYHLESLRLWLEGDKSGGCTGKRQCDRLKLLYVAMTRPTHLLCLAMRQDSFASQEEIRKLEDRGWHVEYL